MADVPEKWIDRLFDRFVALFGAQKVAGMWAGSPMAVVKQTDAEQLGRLDPDMVRHGLQRCVDDGLEWPPTLPEFVALCRRAVVAAHQPAPLLPSVSRADAAENLRRVRELLADVRPPEPMFWAKHPKSPAAVHLLIRGAASDHRLADILLEHFRTEGVECRSVEAAAEINRLAARADHLELAGRAPMRQPGEDDDA